MSPIDDFSDHLTAPRSNYPVFLADPYPVALCAQHRVVWTGLWMLELGKIELPVYQRKDEKGVYIKQPDAPASYL